MATENAFLLLNFRSFSSSLTAYVRIWVTYDSSEPKDKQRKGNESLCAFGKLGVFTNSDSLVKFGHLLKYLNYDVIRY